MKIGEIAEKTNTPASTIRYYEKEGLLPEARRTASGYRYYEQTTIEQIHQIKLAQYLGFQLNELNSFRSLQGPLDHDLVMQKLDEKYQHAEKMITQLKQQQHNISQIKDKLNGHWDKDQCCPAEQIAELLESVKSI